MEDLIGFLIFVGIVAISVLGKLKTNRKVSEEREQRSPSPLTLDDLPETTRRMLYGEGDIIVATPKHTPRQELFVPPQAPPPPPTPARQIVVERPRPVMAPQPPRIQPVSQGATGRPHVAPAQPQRQRFQQQRRRPAQPVPASATPSQPLPARKPDAVPRPAGSACSPRTRGQEVFAHELQCRSGLARAILLREILGPPRAFDI